MMEAVLACAVITILSFGAALFVVAVSRLTNKKEDN